MKKVFIAAAAVLAFGTASAQDVKFGAKGGLNFATLSNSEGASNLTSFHLGGFVNIGVSDKFSIQPELLYSGQGAKYTGGKSELNYINLPIMAQYKVADDISLEVGPQIGFLMSAKADGTDFKEYMKTTDFGLNLGAAYSIDENMSVGLRYNMGLSQTQKELYDGQSASKNNVIQLSFGYSF